MIVISSNTWAVNDTSRWRSLSEKLEQVKSVLWASTLIWVAWKLTSRLWNSSTIGGWPWIRQTFDWKTIYANFMNYLDSNLNVLCWQVDSGFHLPSKDLTAVERLHLKPDNTNSSRYMWVSGFWKASCPMDDILNPSNIWGMGSKPVPLARQATALTTTVEHGS